MNKFVFLAAMAISATMFVACDDDDEQAVPPTLSINLEEGVLNVGADGGVSTVPCTVGNPVAEGVLSATTEADWITLTCNGNTEISVDVTANPSPEAREAVVAVSYTYGEAKVDAEFTVAQEGAEITADYVFTNPYVAGKVASMMGMSYFALYVSEKEIPMTLACLPVRIMSITPLAYLIWKMENPKLVHIAWGWVLVVSMLLLTVRRKLLITMQ